MADVIGPNFGNEIALAGLAGLPFSWGADGVHISDSRLTAGQKTAINAVVAAHDPTKADPAETYRELLATGCQVVSTATPTLNATYAATGPGWQNMRDVALYIAVFNSFPEELSTFEWTALSGEVVFNSMAEFQAVARGVGFLLGKTSSPPTLPVTIP